MLNVLHSAFFVVKRDLKIEAILCTGAKRVNMNEFTDGNNPQTGHLCKDQLGYQFDNFPSEVTAQINGSDIYWRNAVPGDY